MPDVPPPRRNPTFSLRQSGEGGSSPGLENLSQQADSTADALARIADLEARFLASYQQVQAIATERGATFRLPVPGLPGTNVTVAPAGSAFASETTRAVQRVLDQLRSQTQAAQIAQARITPTLGPSPAPAAPRLPYSATVPLLPTPAPPASVLALQQALRTAPPPLPPGLMPPQQVREMWEAQLRPPLPGAQGLHGERDLQERFAREARIAASIPPPAPPGVPPPSAEEMQRFQAAANRSGNPILVPGFGHVLPEPAAPTARSPLVTLGARVQASQRPQPTGPTTPPVALPQPDLGGLAARMLQTAPQATPALPGGLAARMMALAPPVATLPEAIPVPPTAGPSPLAGRLAGPVQVAQRRAQQADNEAMARQTQEAMQQALRQAEEEEHQNRYRAQHAAYQRLETPLARAAYEVPLRDQLRERMAGAELRGRQVDIEGRVLGGTQARQTTMAEEITALKELTNELKRQALQAQARGQATGTPVGQALVRAQAEVQTSELQRQARLTQMQAGYAQTREGQEQLRQQARARQVHEEAQQQIQRARERAEQGPVLATLSRVLQGAREVGRNVRFGASVATAPARGLLSMEASANPNAAATLDTSWELFKAKAAGGNILTDTLSDMLQSASRAVGRGINPALREIRARARSLNPAWRGHDLYEEPDILRSYQGLPRPQMLSVEQFGMGMQMASLGQGPAETELLRTQMKNMGLSGQNREILEQIARNTAETANQGPSWRA